MAFEAMRLHVDRSGKAPKAFMLTCGSLAMARARAQFSCNFFACAGIKVIDNTSFKSIEEGVKAALESKAEIVVVCASDDDYAEAAPKVKEPARRQGDPRGCGRSGMYARTGSPGHQEFHQRQEQRTRNTEVLPQRNGYLKSKNHESKIFRFNI